MIYPHLFHNVTTKAVYVNIALSDYSMVNADWMGRPEENVLHSETGEVVIPTVDITFSTHIFEQDPSQVDSSEKRAYAFIASWFQQFPTQDEAWAFYMESKNPK